MKYVIKLIMLKRVLRRVLKNESKRESKRGAKRGGGHKKRRIIKSAVKWMIWRRLLSLCLIFLVPGTALLSGCASGKTGTEVKGPVEKRIKIGLSFDTFVLERWMRERDVFVATAQKLGADVIVQNANGSVEKQKEQLTRFIREGVDVIVLVAVDTYQVKEEVEAAKNSGIAVISYDRMVENAQTDLYITVDNATVGKLMAETIREKVHPGGSVVMICGPAYDSNTAWVNDAFEKELEGSDLRIIRRIQVESWYPESGFTEVEQVLADMEGVDGIMCGNDGLAGFAIKALSEKQLAGKVVVTGQDADVEACQRIVEGTQSMTVYKPIDELAQKAALCAVQLGKGEPISDISSTMRSKSGMDIPYIGLKPLAVTKENMDEVVIQSGFHPREDVYLNLVP